MLRRSLIYAPLLMLVVAFAASRQTEPLTANDEPVFPRPVLGVDHTNTELVSGYRSVDRFFRVHRDLMLDEELFRAMQEVLDSIFHEDPPRRDEEGLQDLENRLREIYHERGDPGAVDMITVGFRQLRRSSGLPPREDMLPAY